MNKTKWSILISLLTLTVFMYPLISCLAVPPSPSTGFEEVTNETLETETIAFGQPQIVQVVKVKDDDSDNYGVTVTSVYVDNLGTAQASDMKKVEVLNKKDSVVGSVTIDSLPVEIPVSNFTIPDDGEDELKLKLYLLEAPQPQRTIKTNMIIVHDEGSTRGFRLLTESQTSVEITGGYSIAYVVSHWDTGNDKLDPDDDPTISMEEILNGISWWADGTEVPETGGKTISLQAMLELINSWADGIPVGE